MTIVEYLCENPASCLADIAEGTGRGKRSVSVELTNLKRGGRVQRSDGRWNAVVCRPGRGEPLRPPPTGRPAYDRPAVPLHVAQTVRARRDLLSLSRAAVAEKAGVPMRAVALLERGKGSLATALAIWTALGLDLRPVESTEVPTEDRPAVRAWLVARLAEV